MLYQATEALKSSGLSPYTKEGARVYTPPQEYNQVLKTVEELGLRLSPAHVIASGRLKDSIQELVEKEKCKEIIGKRILKEVNKTVKCFK